MSLIDSHFAAANDHAAELLGDAEEANVKRPTDVDYTPLTGVIATPEQKVRRRTDSGLEIIVTRDVIVKESSLPGAVSRVDLMWQLDGVNYTVDEITDAHGGYKCMTIMRAEKREISRGNYRGRS